VRAPHGITPRHDDEPVDRGSIAFEEIASDKIVMTRPGEADEGEAAGEPSEALEAE
jgi:hypothetical protein